MNEVKARLVRTKKWVQVVLVPWAQILVWERYAMDAADRGDEKEFERACEEIKILGLKGRR